MSADTMHNAVYIPEGELHTKSHGTRLSIRYLNFG
jgi:hypothetical protein